MIDKIEKLIAKTLKQNKYSSMQKLERSLYLARFYCAEDFDSDVKMNMSEMHREEIIIDGPDGKMTKIQPFYDFWYDYYNHQYAKRVCELINNVVTVLEKDVDFGKISAYDKKLIDMANLVNDKQKFEEAFNLENIDSTINGMLRQEKEDEMCK